jgi:hypothetical protein
LTENEWNQSHPEQCRSYLDAWTNAQKRNDQRHAALQLIIAQCAGVKISGRWPGLSDFLPDYAKPKRRQRPPEEIEADLKAAFRKLANHSKPNG